MREIDAKFEKYDETGESTSSNCRTVRAYSIKFHVASWPSTLDEFVSWVRENKLSPF